MNGGSRLDVSLVAAAGLLSLTAMLEMGIVNLAFPSIAADFGRGPGAAQWVILAYQLPLVICLLPAGMTLSVRPLRPMLFGALAAFGACGIVACFTPPSPFGFWWLVAVRAVQGATAAMLFVLMPVLATLSAPPSLRARALSVTATLGPLGAVLGPPISGWIVDHFDWRAVFLVKIPLVAMSAVLAWRSLGQADGGPSPDLATRGPTVADDELSMLRRLRTVVQSHSIRSLLLATALMAAAAQAMQFTVSFLLQSVGWTASASGAALCVVALVMAGTGAAVGVVADRCGPSVYAIGGAAVVSAGSTALAWALGMASTAAVVVLLAAIGLGMGLYGGPTQAWVLGTAAPNNIATAASMMQLARSTGFAAGPSLAGTLLGVGGGPEAALAASGIMAVIALCAFVLARRDSRPGLLRN